MASQRIELDGDDLFAMLKEVGLGQVASQINIQKRYVLMELP